MSILLAIAAFLSALFFPWPLTVVLAVWGSYYETLLPLAVGIFADALYYVPGTGWPLGTIFGLVGSIGSYLIRSRFQMR